MRHCLSDDQLAAAQADLAGRPERDHLAACEACARRHAGLARDLGLIARALVDTAGAAPVPRVRRARRRLASALVLTGAIAAGIAAMIWIDTAVWNAITPPRPADPREIAALLDQLSQSSSAAGDAGTDPDALIREVDAATAVDPIDDCDRAGGASCGDEGTRVSDLVNGE